MQHEEDSHNDDDGGHDHNGFGRRYNTAWSAGNDNRGLLRDYSARDFGQSITYDMLIENLANTSTIRKIAGLTHIGKMWKTLAIYSTVASALLAVVPQAMSKIIPAIQAIDTKNLFIAQKLK